MAVCSPLTLLERTHLKRKIGGLDGVRRRELGACTQSVSILNGLTTHRNPKRSDAESRNAANATTPTEIFDDTFQNHGEISRHPKRRVFTLNLVPMDKPIL